MEEAGRYGVGAGLGWSEGGGLEGCSEWERPSRNGGGASECLGSTRLVRGWVGGESEGVQAGAEGRVGRVQNWRCGRGTEGQVKWCRR